MSYLLGLDIGSTNLKAALYDLSGNTVAVASEPTEKINPCPANPEWAVWEPDQIWGGIADAIQGVTSKIGDAKEIKGVAVTGMGMDGVPIGVDGNALYPFISWHCPRTMPQQEQWLDLVGAEKQFSISGGQIWPFNTVFRLMWMMEHEPAILERTHKWLLIEDYVNYMLCGECATDYSMASTTLLFDQSTQQWSDELIRIAGIDADLLCDAKASGTVLGAVHAKAAERTGLAVGTPVALGGHDYSCGCLPTGAFTPGAILDVIGTWEMVVTSLNQPTLEKPLCDMGALVDSHVAPDQWAIMIAAVAGDMTEWFKSELGSEDVKQAAAEGRGEWSCLIERASTSPPGANGVLFLPHMSGSHSPVVDPSSAGAFVGLRNTHTRADMFRAVIEGINFQFKEVIDNLEMHLANAPDKIIAIGGPTKNPLWMQSKADMTAKAVEIPEIEEPVTLGAAMLAGLAAGVYSDLPQAYEAVRKGARVVEPNEENREAYLQAHQEYAKLYPVLKGIGIR